ncbi:MAG: hypothetical protein ACJAZ3_000259 [Sphingobacteriales bacterium]|jgi:hypothetical protein
MTLSKKQLIITVLFFFLLYSYQFINGSGRISANDGGHISLAKAIYHDHSLEIEKYFGEYAYCPDYAAKDGKIYSDRLPGNAFLIIPFFAFADGLEFIGLNFSDNKDFEIVVAHLLPTICGTLALFLFYLILLNELKISWKSSIITVIIVAFGSFQIQISSMLFSHAPSMFFAMLSIYMTLKIARKESNLEHWLILSFALGFGTLIELQNLLFAMPIGVFILGSKKLNLKKEWRGYILKIGLSLMVFLTFIGLLYTYNYLAFGEWFLKSNTYNPEFPEEKSFLTSLSGNFLMGLDKLFTNFTSLNYYYDWGIAIKNKTPGYFASAPIFLLSLFGLRKLFLRDRALFFLIGTMCALIIAVAAAHVTTVTRHIFTINLLLFVPFAFIIESYFNWKSKALLKYSVEIVVLVILILSICRQFVLTNSYFSRSLEMPLAYWGEIWFFTLINIPLIVFLTYRFLKTRKEIIS